MRVGCLLALAGVLLLAPAARAQRPARPPAEEPAPQPAQPLTPEQVAAAEAQLRQALAGPRERAFLQVLTEVHVVPALPADTTLAYDLLVRYDPARFRDARVGRYPLSFDDQMIAWGKRVAVLTRAVDWSSRRFYLHDVSTAREGWLSTEVARSLYQPPGKAPTRGAPFSRWLPLINGVGTRTDVRTQVRWLRCVHAESHDRVARDALAQPAAPAPSPPP